jgi:hypothetical protein
MVELPLIRPDRGSLQQCRMMRSSFAICDRRLGHQVITAVDVATSSGLIPPLEGYQKSQCQQLSIRMIPSLSLMHGAVPGEMRELYTLHSQGQGLAVIPFARMYTCPSTLSSTDPSNQRKCSDQKYISDTHPKPWHQSIKQRHPGQLCLWTSDQLCRVEPLGRRKSLPKMFVRLITKQHISESFLMTGIRAFSWLAKSPTCRP